MDQYTDYIKTFGSAVGGAIFGQFVALISSQIKSRRTIKEMRALIREQIQQIKVLREENLRLKPKSKENE